MEHTRFTNVEVTGELKVSGTAKLPAATTATAGAVKMAVNVAGAAGDAPTKAEFEALLDALIAAGIMASS